jgi:hypothetical protein
MINAKELRLDNWVMADGQPTQITQMDFEQWTFDLIDPIPLTPELLEACGFTMSKWDKPWLHVSKWEKNDLVLWSEKDNGFCFLINGMGRIIKHLHELQNLYHAITGEELEVKIPASTH